MKEKKVIPWFKNFIIIYTLLIFLLILAFPADSDVKLYYYFSSLYHKLRLSPYNGFFFVYPPVALFPILLPGFLANNFESYTLLFQFQMGIFWIISFYLFYKILKMSFLKKETIEKNFVFLIFSLLVLFFISNRIDIFMMALILASIYFLFNKKLLLSSLFLSLAIWTKFYPVIFLPLFFFFVLKNYELKKTVWWSISFCLIFLLTFLTFALNFSFSNSGFYSFFYHFNRPVHIESLYGGILLLLEKFKIPALKVRIKNDIYGFSLYELSLLKIVSPLSSFLILFVFGISILKIIRNEKFSEKDFLKFFMLFTLSFIILNRVFSPQYLVWLLPFAPLFFNKNERKIFALVCAITVLIYPLFYKYLVEKNIILILLLNIRNLTLLFLGINFGKKLFFSPNKKVAKNEVPRKSS